MVLEETVSDFPSGGCYLPKAQLGNRRRRSVRGCARLATTQRRPADGGECGIAKPTGCGGDARRVHAQGILYLMP